MRGGDHDGVDGLSMEQRLRCLLLLAQGYEREAMQEQSFHFVRPSAPDRWTLIVLPQLPRKVDLG